MNDYQNGGKEPWEQEDTRPDGAQDAGGEEPASPESESPDDKESSSPEEHKEEGTEPPRGENGESYTPPYNQPPYGGQYGPYGYGNPNGYGNPYGYPGGQENQNGAAGNSGNPSDDRSGSGQEPPQYGGYGPYGYGGQGGQNGGYYNPYGYGGGYGPYGRPPMPPKRMNTGLKVFLWFLGVIAVGLVIAFGVYSVRFSSGNRAENGGTSSSASSALPEQGGSASSSQGSVVGSVPGNGTNPNSSGITISSKPQGSQLSATNVYKKVIPSVVGVETMIPSQSGQQSQTSEGTGIIATSDGYILTNAHVVNYSRDYQVKVVLHNNKEYAAKVVGYDKTSDLAVLKINATGLSPAELGSVDGMQVGDSVIAIGNPGGLSFAGSLTGGYISALNRTIEDASDNGMTYIQTDAAINPGNSGGPLVNLYGQVIGINSNKIVATGYEGMGFAIPVSHAKSIIDDLIAHGYVAGRTRLGITASTVDSMSAQFYSLPQGVLIASVSSDSSLKGKVAKGDVITKAGGTKITSMDDLYAVLAKHKPGDVVEMTIVSTMLSEEAGGQKSGTTRNVKVTLLEDKGETQKAQ